MHQKLDVQLLGNFLAPIVQNAKDFQTQCHCLIDNTENVETKCTPLRGRLHQINRETPRHGPTYGLLSNDAFISIFDCYARIMNLYDLRTCLWRAIKERQDSNLRVLCSVKGSTVHDLEACSVPRTVSDLIPLILCLPCTYCWGTAEVTQEEELLGVETQKSVPWDHGYILSSFLWTYWAGKKKIRQKKYETVPRLTSELEVKRDYFSWILKVEGRWGWGRALMCCFLSVS